MGLALALVLVMVVGLELEYELGLATTLVDCPPLFADGEAMTLTLVLLGAVVALAFTAPEAIVEPALVMLIGAAFVVVVCVGVLTLLLLCCWFVVFVALAPFCVMAPVLAPVWLSPSVWL